VKALLQHTPSRTLYEVLPNYLSRNGVDVIWRSSNWGTPPLHIEKRFSKSALKKLYPEVDDSFDGILFHALEEQIAESKSDKVFIGIHTYTSHGPEYYSNTPDSFKVFLPECTTVEMANAKYEELINAYDNTVVYTDYLVHSVIEMLKREFPDRRSCVIFISDHGESLGEGGLYMHGVPMATAPAEQLDIPFIVWTSENAATKVKDIEEAGHYHIYHSVLHFLGMQTPFYDETKNIFE
jgi:lipid A ethanolaminephosphotransferase